MGGVSSFGYSGTIAHAVLRSPGHGTATQSTHSAGSKASFHRSSFPWSDPPHPLLQQRIAQSDCLAVFRSPTAGRLHALVSEHVVQGRVVFPGAAYLETARAAWAASTSLAVVGACLHGVFFLQPLALDAEAHSTTVLVECVLREGGLFEVRSGDVAALQGHDASTHCTGTASASTAPPQQLRRCCGEAKRLCTSWLCGCAVRGLLRCGAAVWPLIPPAAAGVDVRTRASW